MNQSINTDSKNSKEPQQKYRLGTVSIKILGGLNRFKSSSNLFYWPFQGGDSVVVHVYLL